MDRYGKKNKIEMPGEFAVKFKCLLFVLLAVLASGTIQGQGQGQAQGQGQGILQSTALVPRLVSYTGKAVDSEGRTFSGSAGVTFAIYREQSEGAPLWIETQNVQADSKGNYTAQLGATKRAGLPLDLFTSGEARWLGVRINGGEEQPRVLLLSVPYALKAADAETIGGLPPSAFVLAAPAAGGMNPAVASATPTTTPTQTVTGAGTTGQIPLWDSSSDLTSSILTQTGSGSTARVGINITSPATTLDVKGTSNFRGTATMPSAGLATASAGKTSYPFVFATSAYNSGAKASVLENFRWQAEPAGNNSSSPSGTLNLLFSSGTNTPVETGLSIAGNGQITFAPGQTFPGGSGTITGVTAGKDLTGGGTSGTVTLNLDTTKVPLLAAANTFIGNQTVNGNLASTGVVTGSSYQIGSDLFGFGSHANLVSFVGFAGSAASIGEFNTGAGAFALGSNTTGRDNTAVGANAMFFNAIGYESTAVGSGAMTYNTDSIDNTAIGFQALYGTASSNSNSSANTAVGALALYSNTNGIANVAVGVSALTTNATGISNIAVGYGSLGENVSGSNNAALGNQALLYNTTGIQNTAVGAEALVGNTTGQNLTCVGYSCTAPGENLHDATAIGARSAVTTSDSLVLGSVAGVNGATTTTRVGIGTTAPGAILTIGRGAGHPVSDSWETYSSRRWKTNIQTLPDALAKVEQLRGVTYDLKDSGKHEIGVIAEEVGAVVPELVSYEANGKDARGVDYSRLTALLIEATKQQQEEIEQQRKLIRAQAAASRAQQQSILRQQAALRAQQAAIRDLKSQVQATRQALQKIRTQSSTSQATTLASAK